MSSIHEHDHTPPNQSQHHQPHPQRPHYPTYGAIQQRPYYPQQSPQALHHYASFSSSTTEDLTPNSNTVHSTSISQEFDEQHEGDFNSGTPIEPDDEVYGSAIPPRSSSGSSEPFDDPATFRSHGAGVDSQQRSQAQSGDSGSPGGLSAATSAVKREASQMDASISLSSSSSTSGMTVGVNNRPGTSKSSGALPANNFVAKLYT